MRRGHAMEDLEVHDDPLGEFVLEEAKLELLEFDEHCQARQT